MAGKKQPLYEFVIPREPHPTVPGMRRIRYLPAYRELGERPPAGGYIQKYANLQRYRPGAAGMHGGLFELACIRDAAHVEIAYTRISGSTIVSGDSVVTSGNGSVAIHGSTQVHKSTITPAGAGALDITDSVIDASHVGAVGVLDSVQCYRATLGGNVRMWHCEVLQGLTNAGHRLYASGIAFKSTTNIRCPISLIGRISLRASGPGPLIIAHPDDLYLLASTYVPHGIVAYRDGRITVGCQEWDWRNMCGMTQWATAAAARNKHDTLFTAANVMERNYPGIDAASVFQSIARDLRAYYKRIGWQPAAQ